ncbi:MAG: hypothetical protein IKG27_01770 [Bacilli bacterium]|nr:hypothetical protein [Bacilli bacterium]
MIYDNEEIVMKANEHTKNIIKKELAIGGFKKFDYPFLNTREYERLLIDMTKSKKTRCRNARLNSETMSEINKKGKLFISTVTEDINTKIPYLNTKDDSLEIHFLEKNEENTINDNNYIDFMNFVLKKSKKTDIIKIPIEYFGKKGKNGWSVTYLPYRESIDLNILGEAPYISMGIGMENQGDELSFSVLVHEYTHTLINRHKGIVENYANDELLSIFMELLSAHEQDQDGRLLNAALISRLEAIRKNIIKLNLEKQDGYLPDIKAVYINSTIYAIDLLDMYIRTSIKGKKAILNEIKKTLVGERTLEETLIKLDASEERGSQIIRTKVKTLLN